MTLDNDRGDEPRPRPGSGSSAPATDVERRVSLVVALLIGIFVLLAIGDLLGHRSGEVSFGRMLYGLEGVDAVYAAGIVGLGSGLAALTGDEVGDIRRAVGKTAALAVQPAQISVWPEAGRS